MVRVSHRHLSTWIHLYFAWPHQIPVLDVIFTKDGAKLKKASPLQCCAEIQAFEWNERKKNSMSKHIKLSEYFRPLANIPTFVISHRYGVCLAASDCPGVMCSLSKQRPRHPPSPALTKGQCPVNGQALWKTPMENPSPFPPHLLCIPRAAIWQQCRAVSQLTGAAGWFLRPGAERHSCADV